MARRMPTASANAVQRRSGGLCERCGRAAEQIHHRKPRGMGGSGDPLIHDPANLLHLCAACHGWVEANRSLALGHGWLVYRASDPATSPLFRWGRWWDVGELMTEHPIPNDPPF